MSGLNFAVKASLIFQVVVLGTTLSTDPALANPSLRPIDFNDYSQSRQFFDGGNRQFERQIELLEADLQPVKIKLPQNYNLPQDLKQPDSLEQQSLSPDLDREGI